MTPCGFIWEQGGGPQMSKELKEWKPTNNNCPPPSGASQICWVTSPILLLASSQGPAPQLWYWLTHKHAWGTPARGPADEQDVGGAGHRSSESCAAQNQGTAYFQVGSGGLLHEVSLMRVRKGGVWEPQASASGRVYQLTEASVLIASLHSHPPVQLHKVCRSHTSELMFLFFLL